MTELIYNHQLYKNFQPGQSIIIDLEKTYTQQIVNRCKPTDLFVNSIWFEYDDEMIRLLDKNPTRAIIYSGMDWHDYGYRKNVHLKLKEKVNDIVYVGNTGGEGYFSFWLFFVKSYFDSFYRPTPKSYNINKLFMCLNRKRHEHRVHIVNSIFENNLHSYGYVTLGGDHVYNIAPITLPDDIINVDGDKTVGNNVEGITNDISSLGNLKYWDDHLINIVTETTVNTDTFITEKTWKPISGLKPFMILGDPKIYDYLKEYGIDTFDDLFGTGYTAGNWQDRSNWIIENLKKYTDVNYNKLYESILPRLVLNRDKMQEIFTKNKHKFNSILQSL